MLSDRQLQQLGYNIGTEWQALGTYLRFSHSEITKMQHEHPHNTDAAILQMLKTWNARQRNKSTDAFGVLSEALRLAGRGDLTEQVQRWKVDNAGSGGPVVWGGQGVPPGGGGGGGGQPRRQQQQPGLTPFQQVYGAATRPNKGPAPATQSKPPEVRVDVTTLPQYKTLVEMFPSKAAQIETMLRESPNIDENALIDKLLVE